MSATAASKLAGLADRLSIAEWQTRKLDDRIVSIAGSLGQIRPFHGELLVLIQQRTSAALVRQLLGLGILDVAANGDMKLGRMPRADEAPLLRDLLGLHVRRT